MEKELCKYCKSADCDCAKADEIAKSLGDMGAKTQKPTSKKQMPRGDMSPSTVSQADKEDRPVLQASVDRSKNVMKSDGSCPTCGCNPALLAKAFPDLSNFQSKVRSATPVTGQPASSTGASSGEVKAQPKPLKKKAKLPGQKKELEKARYENNAHPLNTHYQGGKMGNGSNKAALSGGAADPKGGSRSSMTYKPVDGSKGNFDIKTGQK